MSEPQWNWQCDHVIRSKTGAGQRVRQEVIEQLQEQNWIEHDIFSVHLAMEEALANAIKHGNRLDMDKHVHFTCRLSNDLVRIEVADEGNGFDPSRIPDPTDKQHRQSPHGRGVMLMRNFMDRVEYNEIGNRVLLEKNRTKPD